ncbi:MAG: hypothetical protein J5497_08570, partial [Selenomonadaceae bacterium]|nr:hypothetical protein [Selenomonadaceae bacterium]
MYNKNIMRYMTIGEPVIIGAKPKPVVEEEPEPEVAEDSQAADAQDSEATSEAEVEPNPEPEIDYAKVQAIRDEIFAKLDEIERQSKLAEEALQQAQEDQAQAERLRQQARKIRNDARDESDKLVADTKKEAAELLERVRKEGYDTGYKEGKEQGIADGKERIEDELADIVRQANAKAQKTIQDAKEQTAEYFIRAEDEIVKVLMMAIDKILPQHFLDVPQVILPVVREAIRHVRDQKEVKVHVEPDSYDLILMARS